MEFILGKDLDGAHFSSLDIRPAVFGKWITGQNFLEVLETFYGLSATPEDDIVRVAQYLQALDDVDDGKRFYSASFGRDRFAAAARILGIRDELLMSAPCTFSWSVFIKDKGRLGQLALVEDKFTALDPEPGYPERLGAVIGRIEENRITNPVRKIFFTDPETSWQTRWQLVFTELAARGTEVDTFYPRGTQAPGDLGVLQQSAQNGLRGEVSATGDGSVLRINAHGLLEGADTAATIIDSFVRKDGPDSVAVIREQYADILDNALERRGMPLIGSRRQGGQQGILQVLIHLVLLLKKPVDPAVMRSFLLLPHCPVPEELRKQLIRHLSFNPSTGGWGWEKRIGEYYAGHEDQVGTAVFLENGRFPSGKLKIDMLLELCDRLADWARESLCGNPEAVELEKCSKQTDLLKTVLGYYREPEISTYSVQNILERINRSLPEPETRTRQVGAAQPVNSPGGILSPVKTLVWWAAVESTVTPVEYPVWNTREQQALKQNGIVLQNPRDEIAARTLRWQRALAMAGERLVMISMDRTADDDGPHPFWYELIDTFRPEPDPDMLLTRRADDFTALKDLAESLLLTEHPEMKLEKYREDWKVPDDLVRRRDKESPSGLETFVSCPLQWSLRYTAGLTDPDGYSLPEGPQLMGSVAHIILGGYLAGLGEWPEPDRARREINDLFDRRIGQLAGIMELPAWAEEREMVRNSIGSAAGRLVSLFCGTPYRVEGRETRVQAVTPAGPLEGRTDLVLANRENENDRLIIDLKMRSRNRYIDVLKSGRAYQLAAYSRIMKEYTGSWVPAAYFIINTGELLTVHGKSAFPGCVTVKGPDEKATWDKLEAEEGNLRNRIHAGLLPVGIPEESFKKSSGGRLCPAKCQWCPYRLFCGVDVQNE